MPALDGVAVFAVGSELAAVDIRMAICAAGTYILEYQAGVALDAGDLLVHSSQRVTGFIVTELGIGSNGPPTRVSVAVLARHGDGTMRVSYLCLRSTDGRVFLLCRRLRCHGSQQGRENNTDHQKPTRPVHHPSPSSGVPRSDRETLTRQARAIRHTEPVRAYLR